MHVENCACLPGPLLSVKLSLPSCTARVKLCITKRIITDFANRSGAIHESASMELNEALLQISVIRQQLARTEQFRGYRAAPVALSGVLACLGGIVQAVWISDPMTQLGTFLCLWISVATISLTICLGDVWRRYRHHTGLLHRETMHFALEQFSPSLLAGALLTIVISKSASHSAWMLPGLWAILFSLGLFASWRLLPSAIFGVATYFLASGLVALSLQSREETLSAWTMPLLFGIGQFLTATVLLLSERKQTGAGS